MRYLPVLLLVVLLSGCGGSTDVPSAKNELDVNAAIGEIARRGLSVWASYGSSQIEHVVLLPDSNNGVPVNIQSAVWLPSNWNDLSLTEQGRVLLKALWTWKYKLSGDPAELAALLARYDQG